jgi:hypothetical protein
VLHRLALPIAAVTGKRLLLLGRHTEATLAALANLGAAEITLLDDADTHFAAAQSLAPHLTCIKSSWLSLPDSTFDIVLIDDPPAHAISNTMFAAIRARLAPAGLICMRCPAIPDLTQKARMAVVKDGRSQDFPTFRLLVDDILDGFSARDVNAEMAGPDTPLAFFSLRCTPLAPTIFVLGGQPQAGKTTLARLLTRNSAHALHTDFWLEHIQASAGPNDPPFYHYVAQNMHRSRIDHFTRGLIAAGKTDEFCDALLRMVSSKQALTVVEGYAFVHDEICDALKRLGGARGYRVVVAKL